MHHTIYCIATSDNNDGTVNAVAGLNGETDVTAVPPGGAAIIESIAGPMGLTFSNLSVDGGDTIAVTGPLGSIPDYQVGMFLTVSEDGRAYFPNAGHLAAAFTAAQ